MAVELFSFEKKDFVITTEKDNAKARGSQMEKLREALESRLSDNFKNFKTYTSKHWYQARKRSAPKGVYRNHTWIGFYEQEIYHWQKEKGWKRDVPQFQVSLNDKGLHILVDIDHSSRQAREAICEVIKKHKDECFDILKKLGNDWSVRVKSICKSKKFKAIPLPDHENMVWSISQLKLEDMDVIINYLTYPSGELDVEKNFTESEALSMKTSIVDELSNGFEKLHPLYTFLTEQNSPKSQILSGKYLLLRNLEESKWDDVSTKKYHFSRSLPNGGPDQMRPGTKAIWFDREDQNIYFVGYGTISKIIDLTDGSNNAVFDDFNAFEKEHNSLERDGMFLKKGTSEIFEKIKTTTIDGGNTWSDNNSMIRTTKEIYEEITNDRDSNLDKKFEEWLKRGAKKAGKSIEDYARDLGKDEYEARYKTYSKLKVVLEKEPIDLIELSTISKVTTCIGAGSTVFGDHYTNDLLTRFLEDQRAEGAVRSLAEYKNETDVHTFYKTIEEVMPAGREAAGDSERRVGIDPAQALLIASVFLTALQPDKFVDYRKNRWGSLAKQIGIEEEFATATNCALNTLPEEIGKFAKRITETPTFKKYWSNQSHPLWTLAGICWAVKDSNVTESIDTGMDEMVEEILNMNFKLAIKEDVVKRIIRHLQGGKDVVLVGAPGVGKTALADRVLRVVGKDMIGNSNYYPAVAYAEWTRGNVIGRLNLEKPPEFVPGCVTSAAENDQWLLIDEFNRADINKAFGEMFLGIESKKIELSEEESKARALAGKLEYIKIPEKFRMVCTMNDFDKNLLLTELSYGLITRFAFVDIEPDLVEEKKSVQAQIIKRNQDLKEAYADCENVIEKFYEFITDVRKTRMIGVRTCIDIIRYTVSASKEDKNKVYDFLDEALCDYLWLQFDRLDKKVISDVLVLSKKHLPQADKFTKHLVERKAEWEKLAGWMGGSEQEEKDGTDVTIKKDNTKSVDHHPDVAVATMKGYLNSPKKLNKKTGLTGIQWAKQHPNDPYGYSKKILGKDWKKYSTKKKT